MKRLNTRRLGLVLLFLTLALEETKSQEIYFSVGALLEKADLDGTNRRSLIPFSNDNARFIDFDFDLPNRRIIWATYDPLSRSSTWLSSDLEGEDPRFLFRVAADVRAFAVTADAETIFFTVVGESGKLESIGADGTNRRTLVSAAGGGLLGNLLLDEENGKLYWTSSAAFSNSATIRRSNLDGSNVEVLQSALGSPGDVVREPTQDKIYWSDRRLGRIQCATAQGGQPANTILSQLGNPAGVAVDMQAGHLYWVDTQEDKIFRSDLDGQHPEVLLEASEDLFRMKIKDASLVRVAPQTWQQLKARYR